MILTLLVFILSLGVLVFSSDRLLDSLGNIGIKLQISDAILAFFLIAIGTSLPEMIASLAAAQTGDTDLAIANLFGSNLTNSLLIGGLLVLAGATASRGKGIFKKRNLMLFASLVAVLAVWLLPTMLAAFALLLTSALILYVLLKLESASPEIQPQAAEQEISDTSLQLYGKAGLWLVVLVASGLFTVSSVESLGALLGLSATLVGLVFLAFGTSLPELVTSWIAVRKGKADIAFATLLGSNVINVTFVLGLTLSISGEWQGITRDGLTLAVLATLATAILALSLHTSKALKIPLGVLSLGLYGASIWAVS